MEKAEGLYCTKMFTELNGESLGFVVHRNIQEIESSGSVVHKDVQWIEWRKRRACSAKKFSGNWMKKA